MIVHFLSSSLNAPSHSTIMSFIKANFSSRHICRGMPNTTATNYPALQSTFIACKPYTTPCQEKLFNFGYAIISKYAYVHLNAQPISTDNICSIGHAHIHNITALIFTCTASKYFLHYHCYSIHHYNECFH